MNKKNICRSLVGLLLVACMSVGLFGCLGTNQTSSNTEQQDNRAYMSQVNEIVIQASDALDEFAAAVSSGDVVAIQTTANTALRELDKISSLEAPDTLKDVHESYKSGSQKLSDALKQYIDIYTNIENGSLSREAAQAKIADIQTLYDEGIADLKKGDEDAAAL